MITSENDGRIKKGSLSKKEKEQHRRSYNKYKESYKIRAKQWKLENPNKKRISNRKNQIKRKYGLSWEQYNSLYNSQEGKCRICKKFLILVPNKKDVDSSAAVDHCHLTGKVRGLLCRRCNVALGFLDDKIENLRNAIEYLKNDTP